MILTLLSFHFVGVELDHGSLGSMVSALTLSLAPVVVIVFLLSWPFHHFVLSDIVMSRNWNALISFFLLS